MSTINLLLQGSAEICSVLTLTVNFKLDPLSVQCLPEEADEEENTASTQDYWWTTESIDSSSYVSLQHRITTAANYLPNRNRILLF